MTTLTNAAGAKLRGLEFTADGNLTESLSFNAGVNWMPTAGYTNYKTASVVVPIPGSVGPIFGQTVVPYDASGSRVIKAPEWTANLRLTYATPFMGGEFAATISDAYSPGFYWQAGNLTKEPAYNVANMRLSWTDPNDRFTYSLWATNLTDELYSYYTTPNARGNSNTYPQGRQSASASPRISDRDGSGSNVSSFSCFLAASPATRKPAISCRDLPRSGPNYSCARLPRSAA